MQVATGIRWGIATALAVPADTAHIVGGARGRAFDAVDRKQSAVTEVEATNRVHAEMVQGITVILHY